ncbi:hypothetical protein GOP47_0009025 [Adiantum capillus-veneris]|uniref:Pentatricopeptide repeat-containing protein n=1 Tax=Adiantum capillus-veneris TaxID=13818 RepID=A0A9D4ZL97_ADICA|nr:hypothetical protein GOP47_0009025 [Adiantum capillus-veneris]
MPNKGRARKRWAFFSRCKERVALPNAITYTCIFKTCGSDRGICPTKAGPGSAGLFSADAKRGLLSQMQSPTLVSSRHVALIAGYAQQRQGQEALGFFQQMQREGCTPKYNHLRLYLQDMWHYADADMGKRIHGDIVSQRLLEKNEVLGTILACIPNVVHLRKHRKCLTSLLFRAASLRMHRLQDMHKRSGARKLWTVFSRCEARAISRRSRLRVYLKGMWLFARC